MTLLCTGTQVKQVVHDVESLTRISFLAHSLGGLFARYAISVLYSQDHDLTNDRRGNKENSFSPKPSIAGLEPVNFITLATPHLGVRGKNQVFFLAKMHRFINVIVIFLFIYCFFLIAYIFPYSDIFVV